MCSDSSKHFPPHNISPFRLLSERNRFRIIKQFALAMVIFGLALLGSGGNDAMALDEGTAPLTINRLLVAGAGSQCTGRAIRNAQGRDSLFYVAGPGGGNTVKWITYWWRITSNGADWYAPGGSDGILSDQDVIALINQCLLSAGYTTGSTISNFQRSMGGPGNDFATMDKLGISFDFRGDTYRWGLFGETNTQVLAEQIPAKPRGITGPPQTVASGAAPVTLDATPSENLDPRLTLSYQWTQVAGPPVTLSDATASQPTFTAPTLIAGIPPETLRFRLTVTDNYGLIWLPDTVDIQVLPPANRIPIADAGLDQTVESGTEPVTLEGGGSFDPDQEQTITYQWTQISGLPVVLSSTTAVRPTFRAPTLATGGANETLVFSLVVTDNLGLSSIADTVVITIIAPPVNLAPTANAGPDQIVASGTSPVTLDGSASSDPDVGQTLTYSWSQTGGPPVTLSDSSSVHPTFSAPTLARGTVDRNLAFLLIVTDNLGLASSPDTVIITVIAPPTLVLETPAEGSISNNSTQLVSGRSEPGLEISIVVENEVGQGFFTDTVTADANGNWEVETTFLPDGNYTVTATATDDVENVVSESTNFTVDSTVPSLVVDTPEDNLHTSDGAVVISGSTDSDAIVTVTVRDENGNIVATPEVVQNPDGTFNTVADPELVDGSYTVNVTATGINGASTTVIHNITVDQTPPMVSITQPGENAVLGTNTPTFRGTSEPGAVVDIFLDGDFIGTATTDVNGQWSFEVTDALDDETYTVEVFATDDAGNVGEGDQVTFTVDVEAPNVVILTPEDGEKIDFTPAITGLSEPGTEVEIFLNGELVGTAITDDDGEWSFTFESPLEDGDYTIEATASSTAGNTGSSGVISFEISTSVNVAITSPADGDTVDSSEITVTGTGEPGSEVTITIGDQTVTTTVDDDGNWSVVVDELPEGSVTIEVTSDAGDSADSITITVEIFDGIEILTGGSACNSTGSAGSALSWFMVVISALSLVAMRRRSSLESQQG